MTNLDLERLVATDRIVRIKLAFGRAADAGDPDAMVAAFSQDVRVVYDPDFPLEGREAVRAWYAEKLGPVAASSHHLTNFEVELLDPDHAVLRCYLYSWQRFEPAEDGSTRPDRHRWARYLDLLERERDEWHITSLRLVTGGETPPPDGDRVGEYRTVGFGSVTPSDVVGGSFGSTA